MYYIFDYIFFRAYDFYKKRNSDIPVDRGIQLLSIIQGFLVLDALMIVDFCFDIIDKRYVNKYILGLPVSIVMLVLNEIRYRRMGRRNQFNPLYERWKNENPTIRKCKGIIIVILPVFLLFGVPLMLWTIKHFF